MPLTSEGEMIFRYLTLVVHGDTVSNIGLGMYSGIFTYPGLSDEGGIELGRVEIVSKLTSPEGKNLCSIYVLRSVEFELHYIS
jgi:hypothetical protein